MNTADPPSEDEKVGRAVFRPPTPLLSVNLTVDYPDQPGVLRNARLEVFKGEILGLVGQSGSGKTTLALSSLKLLDYTGARVQGRMEIDGVDVSNWSERQMRTIRGRLVALIPQSPTEALNPALRLETHLREAWRAHSRAPWRDQASRIHELFESAGLPAGLDFRRRYPREISLGQAQRVLIVMALLHSPRLIIADEPTSSLDVVTQREVLDLLRKMREVYQLGMLYISHDLPAVATICDRIAVLHGGTIVETGASHRVLEAPQHPYTRQLIEAVPKWP
jgi:ABC-type glutathione transport system ATPase component